MEFDKDKIVQIDDLKLLKKHYGENFAKLCRFLFPTILESPGKLYQLISSHFSPNRQLFNDIVDSQNVDSFKAYILYLAKSGSKKTSKNSLVVSPFELMDKAGYILYPECKTEKEVQAFKKYYTADEEICTFWGNRTNLCRVWFAVKKNVAEIKRENFTKPKRQDEYGTSVISIQFTRSKPATLSIKNRYNHTVKNPDATFSNNLDNIIPGLKDAFISYFGIDTSIYKHKLELPRYIKAENDRYYKYNLRIGDAYFCENNVIVNGFMAREYDKSRFLIIDNYILDMSDKTIKKYKNKEFFGFPDEKDAFVDSIGEIEKISVANIENNYKVITILSKSQKYPIKIKINGSNQIIGYYNHNVERIGSDFLARSIQVQEIDLPNLKECGNNFLTDNKDIKILNLPRLEKCGYNFLPSNKQLTNLSLPRLKICGNGFLSSNEGIETLDLPKLQGCGESFLSNNMIINSVNLPKLTQVGEAFLKSNTTLTTLSLPKLRRVGDNFLKANTSLVALSLPMLTRVKSGFLQTNQILNYIFAPCLTSCKDFFLSSNQKLTQLDFPNLKSCGKNFLATNKVLTEVNLPNLQNAGDNFLYTASSLERISLPNLVQCKKNFMALARNLQQFYAPNLTKCGDYFLQLTKLNRYNMDNLMSCGDYFCDRCSENILNINFPSLKKCGDGFFRCVMDIEKINLPALISTGENFMSNCRHINSINMPSLESCGDRFLMSCNKGGKVKFPSLKSVANNFFFYNHDIEEFSAPQLSTIGYNFLCYNRSLKTLNVPNLKSYNEGLLESRLLMQEPLQINSGVEIKNTLNLDNDI